MFAIGDRNECVIRIGRARERPRVFSTLTDRSSCLDNPGAGWNGVEIRGWTRARRPEASINAFPSAPVVIPCDLNSSNIGRCLINGLSENRPLAWEEEGGGMDRERIVFGIIWIV